MTARLSPSRWSFPLSRRLVAVMLVTLACGTDPTGPSTAPASVDHSVVNVSRNVLTSGTAATLTLQLKDAGGRPVGSDGQDVVFFATGGGSTGAIGATADQGDGTFAATFTGLLAGTATTIGASIDGQPVTTPLPTLQVVPGPVAIVATTLEADPRTVVVGNGATLELVTRDQAGNETGAGGRHVVFAVGGGTSTGVIGEVSDHENGHYTAGFLATGAGTPLTVGATVDGIPLTSGLPTVTVAHEVSPDSSTIALSSDTIAVNAGLMVTLRVRDGTGVPRTSGGETVHFRVLSGPGTGQGTIDSTIDHDDGSYTALFTATAAGSPVALGATLNGATVAGPNPTVTILPLPTSPQQSTVSTSRDTVLAGQTATFTARVLDQGGLPVSTGVAVTFALGTEGSSAGNVGPVTNNGDGTYGAVFTGMSAGTATTIRATINDSSQIQMLDSLGISHLPTITVLPGAPSPDSSLLAAAPATVALGDSATIRLTTRDALGNTVSEGGQAVSFQRVGGAGTSMGTIRGLRDVGDGSYTAYYVADSAGTPDTIRATLNGDLVTSGMPTLTVICSAGPVSLAASTVLVNDTTAAQSPVKHVTLPSGVTTTVTLRVRDNQGCPVSSPLTVSFGAVGGTSTGTLGATVDQGDGTYTATFTGRIAGSALTVTVLVDGQPVTSESATITVAPGDISPWSSVVTVSRARIDSGARSIATLQARDSVGNVIVSGGRTVTFTLAGAAAHGSIGPTTDEDNGRYSATYVGFAAEPGAHDSVLVRIEGTPVRMPMPTIEVAAGAIAPSQSVVMVSADSVAAGDSVLVTLIGRDALGRALVTGDRPAVIAFSQVGISSGVFQSVQNLDDGTYDSYLLARGAGTPTTIGATIDGTLVSTPLPVVTVVPGPAAPGTSMLSAIADSLGVGDTTTVELEVLDAFGNPVSDPGLAVVFTLSAPGVVGVDAAAYAGANRYTARLSALVAGTVAVGATVDGASVTTAPVTIRVE